jgi:hypothetical protein
MRALLAALLLLAACGDSGPDHWSKRPTETVAATVDGIAFSIDVPKGMRMEAKPDEVELDFLIDDRVYTPNLHIRASSSGGTADEELKFEKNPNVLRKEDLPDGFVVSFENSAYPGKEDYIVRAARRAGDRWLTCSGRVTRWKKDEKVKDSVPLVEKMCLSIVPK